MAKALFITRTETYTRASGKRTSAAAKACTTMPVGTCTLVCSRITWQMGKECIGT